MTDALTYPRVGDEGEYSFAKKPAMDVERKKVLRHGFLSLRRGGSWNNYVLAWICESTTSKTSDVDAMHAVAEIRRARATNIGLQHPVLNISHGEIVSIRKGK